MSKPARLDKAAIFRAIGSTPHAGQMPGHRSRARFRVVCCGTRFGKTTLAVAEAVAALLTPRKHSIGWTIAPTLDLARLVFDRVAAEFQAHFAHRIKELSLRDQRLVIVNLGGGLSELRGKTTENPASLLGAAVDWLILDEATRVKGDVWDSFLSARLIDRRGWALVISTPLGFDWFAHLHRRGIKRRDPDHESWSMPSWTNPYVSKDMIEDERKRLDEDTFAAQFGAEFIGDYAFECDVCHGPSVDMPAVILCKDGKDPALCVECGEFVDDKGHTLIKREADGSRAHMMLIMLMGYRDGSPIPTPMRAPETAESEARVITSAGMCDN